MPQDYLHLLNCVVVFNKQNQTKCDNTSSLQSMARRLTSDMYPYVLRNAYLKPSPKTPYYFFTDRDNSSIESESDINNKLELLLNPCAEDISISSKDGIEILCGNTSLFKPNNVFVDYLKIPNKINLTYDAINSIV